MLLITWQLFIILLHPCSLGLAHDLDCLVSLANDFGTKVLVSLMTRACVFSTLASIVASLVILDLWSQKGLEHQRTFSRPWLLNAGPSSLEANSADLSVTIVTLEHESLLEHDFLFSRTTQPQVTVQKTTLHQQIQSTYLIRQESYSISSSSSSSNP